MAPGKILVSQDGRSYIIRLVGDVRVTLCASLNNYMEVIFMSEKISEIIVDMVYTEGVDSTTLGLLAKLAIYSNENFKIRPIVFCPDESLYETLMVTGVVVGVMATTLITTTILVQTVTPQTQVLQEIHLRRLCYRRRRRLQYRLPLPLDPSRLLVSSCFFVSLELGMG